MKLLIISRPFVFHGGVERATEGLVAALVEHGHDVHLATPSGQEPLPGVTLHCLSVPALSSTVRALAFVRAAARVADAGTWDVVQSHERTLCQHVYRAGEGCHRGYLASRDDSRSGRGVYHRVVLALERRLFARTPRIVAIARRGRQEIEALYGVEAARLAVVYNGVDLDRFHPGNRERLAAGVREEAGIPHDAWAALFVGSGFERKGLATAIEAFAALSDRRSRLLVIGKGHEAPYRALAARRSVGDRVVWLGLRPDVERWYAAADAVVLPTRYEPFGNVHLEALASGVPVVASALAGGSEVVQEGAAGHVVDPRDAAAVGRALQQLRDASPQRAAAMRSAARRCAEPFTYGAQVAAFSTIWKGILP